jgi:hypothetical protein
MCADLADLVIATGTPVSIGRPEPPTTLSYANVTFEPDAQLIVEGATTLNVSGTFNAGPSGVITAQEVVTMTIKAETVAGVLTVNGVTDADGHVMIYYGSAEPGWEVHSTDQFVTASSRQI